MIHISAIICTYNRADMLKGALESLIEQSLEPHSYEIIVVDNASTDRTPEVVRAFQEKYPEHRIVRLCELQRGLAYARNAGWRHARGRYVAYLDDDARASPDWLKNALVLFGTVKPTPICIGGPILPFYDTPKPEWFKDDYEIRTRGDAPRFLHQGEAFLGSNMVWQKEVLNIFVGFDVTLGVKGSYLSLGEESALFRRIWHSSENPTFFYSPRLWIYHWVPPTKMTISYQLKRKFVSGQVKSQRQSPKGFWNRLLLCVRLLWGIVKLGSLTFRQVKVHSHWQNWLLEEWKPVVKRVGILLGLLGLIVTVRQR